MVCVSRPGNTLAGIFDDTAAVDACAGRFSVAVLLTGCAAAVTADGGAAGNFLLGIVVFTADLTGAGVGGALPLPLSKAGKSSGWCAGCKDCDAIVFDKPEFVASVFKSCFACEVEVTALALTAL